MAPLERARMAFNLSVFAVPVIPGPPPPAALPSRLIWPIDRRVAYELTHPGYRTPRGPAR